jgi:hypothetical protein
MISQSNGPGRRAGDTGTGSDEMILQRDISADYVAARAVQQEILAAATEQGLQGDDFFKAMLSVEEAILQAIKPVMDRMNRFPGPRISPKLFVEADISSAGVKIAIQERG